MGYMTTVTILNDAWSQIKKNPQQFIENIELGINGIDKFDKRMSNKINSYSVGNHCNPMEVAESHHADNFRLYLVGQNMMTMLGYENDLNNIELRERQLYIAKRLIKWEEEEIRKLKNK